MFYEQVVCNSLYQDNKLTKAFREKALVSGFFTPFTPSQTKRFFLILGQNNLSFIYF